MTDHRALLTDLDLLVEHAEQKNRYNTAEIARRAAARIRELEQGIDFALDMDPDFSAAEYQLLEVMPHLKRTVS